MTISPTNYLLDEWKYLRSDSKGWCRRWIKLSTLDSLFAKKRIFLDTKVINRAVVIIRGVNASPIDYSQIARIDLHFKPSIDQFWRSRQRKLTTVLSGPNNAGKTLLLKELYGRAGKAAYLVQCSRYSHVDILNSRQITDNTYIQNHDAYVQNYYTSQQNTEENSLKLENILTGLTNRQLATLFALCSELIGSKFERKMLDDERPFSSSYLAVDGKNLKYSSSGTRLLLTLLGIALDERISTLLVDEPELGLSPKLQSSLMKLLYDADSRKAHFPHIRTLIVATHSHLFLDRVSINNNVIVQKVRKIITLKAVRNVGDFHYLQLNMLGNDLESIFLPSAIVVVEGASDVEFLAKVFKLHIQNVTVAVVNSFGDGKVLDRLHVLEQALGNLSQSPFRNRLFVVLDKKNSLKSKSKVVAKGVPKGNIKEWDNNGIEYLYPKELIAEIYHCNVSAVRLAAFETDPITINGISYSKKILAKLVAEKLTVSHHLEEELISLIRQIKSASL